jgi:hypothetical protein
MKKNKPDFIIVGAMKAGTSSLRYQLGNHSKISIPTDEVHFFNNDSNYNKGLDWYIDRLCFNFTENTVLIGEKTPTYCYQPNVAKRIHGIFPDVKLIWIFREPVSRAYSNYMHAYQGGFDRLSFEEAIKREPDRIRKNIFFGYMERSRYALQVERFLELFPKEQMHFMLFEQFIADTQGELLRLFDFLGISEDGFTFREEVIHKTVFPRWPLSMWVIRQLFGKNTLHKVAAKLNTSGKEPGYPKMDPDFRASLKTRFLDDNEKLATLIDKELDIWS